MTKSDDIITKRDRDQLHEVNASISGSNITIIPADGGEEYLKDQRLILATLKRVEETLSQNGKELTQFKIETATNFGAVTSEITALKIKSGFFGTIGGIVAAAIVAVISFIKGRP
jgi:hypothetical protein